MQLLHCHAPSGGSSDIIVIHLQQQGHLWAHHFMARTNLSSEEQTRKRRVEELEQLHTYINNSPYRIRCPSIRAPFYIFQLPLQLHFTAFILAQCLDAIVRLLASLAAQVEATATIEWHLRTPYIKIAHGHN